jgi:hypothetical protein
MTKTFEQLLSDLEQHKLPRWPTTGDRLFPPPDDPFKGAQTARHPVTRLAVMKEGYWRAADLLVERAVEEGTSKNFLVYPIVFCYRQFLELSLKSTILFYGAPAGVKPNFKSHKLEVQWHDFRTVIEYWDQDEPPDPEHTATDNAVEEMVTEFAKIDPDSFRFRYATTTTGRPTPLTLEVVDLRNLRDLMEALHGYFMGVDGYLGDLASAGPP